MNCLLLAGNSKMNKEWILEVEKSFAPFFEKTIVLDYQHWQKDKPMIDLDVEIEKLGEISDQLGEFIVFAKSAGTLLSIRTTVEGIISPRSALFVGSAINFGIERGFPMKGWFSKYDLKTVFAQKEDDPAIGYDEMVKYLSEFENLDAEFIRYHSDSEPDDDHHYASMDELVRLMEGVLG